MFYPGPDTEEICELYKFAFELPKNRKPEDKGDSKASGDLFKKSTKQLLRAMSNYLQTCETLPTTAQMSFRLIYNDDAPDGYNPPGTYTISYSLQNVGMPVFLYYFLNIFRFCIIVT